MKKFSLLALAAAGLLLGACSSDKDDVAKEVQNGQNFTEGAFIGVTLQLPSSQNTTRANEDFDDGVADEFEVKNAMLYVFQGANEDAATFVGEYVIGIGEEWATDGGTSTDNVTSTYNKATQISNELAADMADNTITDNFYAYVIVNNPGVDAVATGTTFAQFKARQWSLIGTPVAEKAAIGDDGLLMTNAPVCNYAGGTKSPTANYNTAKTADPSAEALAYTTLVKLDRTKVFATASAAQDDPAGCIFIERAAAKITVEVDGTNAAKVGTGSGAPSITFNAWQIINYPSTFYNTRKVNSAWGDLVSYKTALSSGNSDITATDFANWNANNQYRFVSKDAFAPYKPTQHVGPFRTYFAEDPTYTTNGGLNRPQAVADPEKWIAMNERGFTVENTFDVEHQIWQNTTMVTFKATIGSGDFYTVNGGDEIYTQTNALNAVQNGVASIPAVKAAITAASTELAKKEVVDASKTYTYDFVIAVSFSSSVTASANSVPLSVDYDVIPTGNSTKGKSDIPTKEADDLVAALAAALANYHISYYKGGVAYYNARIQHFGEYETPWSATKPFQTVAPGSTVQQIYGVGATPDLSADRFLGRYGVVRDNWYKLKIGAVNHIGTAEPINVAGEGKNTPDDQIENYISVHVHIVPWVIRNQSISF